MRYTTGRNTNDDDVDEQTLELFARAGVIVSAGPLGSPLLLQRSGIGPRAVLEAANIPVIQDLPVGQQAQGRLVSSHFLRYSNPSLAPENNLDTVDDDGERLQFSTGSSGSPFGIATSAGRFILGRDGAGRHTSALPSFFGGGEPVLLTSCEINPDNSSRGSVEVRSDDVNDAPTLRVNGLETADELERARRCARRIRSVHARLALNLTGGGEEVLLDFDDDDADLETDAGLDRFLTGTMDNGLEFVGACGVGRVVDGGFRVMNVDGLRVIDSSVMPNMPTSSGTFSLTLVLAEHAARLFAMRYRGSGGSRRYYSSTRSKDYYSYYLKRYGRGRYS